MRKHMGGAVQVTFDAAAHARNKVKDDMDHYAEMGHETKQRKAEGSATVVDIPDPMVTAQSEEEHTPPPSHSWKLLATTEEETPVQPWQLLATSEEASPAQGAAEPQNDLLPSLPSEEETPAQVGTEDQQRLQAIPRCSAALGTVFGANVDQGKKSEQERRARANHTVDLEPTDDEQEDDGTTGHADIGTTAKGAQATAAEEPPAE